MDIKTGRRSRAPGATTTMLALLLVACLAEGATEQRINSRGSKSSNLIEKVNGWRSQRGGSCLSYGHSCWGAHGKRSGRPPVTAPDWYLTRMLRRMAANTEMVRTRALRRRPARPPLAGRNKNRNRQLSASNDDLSAIFQVDLPSDTPANEKPISENDDIPFESAPKGMEAKPMLDDDVLSKIKIWQIMREAASQEN